MRPALFAMLVACGGRTGLGTSIDDMAVQDGGADVSADVTGRCQDAIIAKDANGATALALDGDTVFWGTTDGRVQRHDAAGTVLLATVGTPPATPITSIAVDAHRVYFTTIGVLHAVPRDGGPTVDVAVKLGQAFALQVDNGVAFLLDFGAGITAGRALRVDPDGTVTTLLAGLDAPSGLAIDQQNVFVLAKGAIINQAFTFGPMLVFPRSGGAATVRTSNLHDPAGVALDPSRVVFIEQVDVTSSFPGVLRSIPKQGGQVTTLMSIGNQLGLDVTLDAIYAYWTAFASAHASLNRTALDGSGSKELATSTDHAQFGAVRTNASAIFWTINWAAGAAPADGVSVRKLCK